MTPDDILQAAYHQAQQADTAPIITDEAILERVAIVVRKKPRAAIRVLLACLLAKIDRPHVDIRKPFTQIDGEDTYSGRDYDETYITRFVLDYDLPVIPTTGFLTPALRAKNILLTPNVNLGGRTSGNNVYAAMLQLLTDVHTELVRAGDLLAETIRQLIIYRDERKQRIVSLLSALEAVKGNVPLSSEDIVRLIEQHLALKGTSRLPVLIVTAIYQVAENYLRERILPLEAHTAADSQTGTIGDVQIALMSDDDIVTAYEMKTRPITIQDIDLAMQKIASSRHQLNNYIFITTEPIAEPVRKYTEGVYNRTGIEIAILDCLEFLRYFLHLFHRLRTEFLDAYQNLVINEPESGVSQPLKEAFLALRQAAEYNDEDSLDE
ncbi:MAG: restriction endonuclease, SacI family [Chloroflexi bacterium]|nr:MAG: restriction endonuclease, SacI family [Chloroflexota bacterium]